MLGKRFLENVDKYSINCLDKKHICHFFIEITTFIIIIFSLARRAAEPREGKRGQLQDGS